MKSLNQLKTQNGRALENKFRKRELKVNVALLKDSLKEIKNTYKRLQDFLRE